MGDVTANMAAAAAAIAELVSAGAEIVVLPELMTSGYMFGDRDEARAVALGVDAREFSSWTAAAGDAVVIGGFCELGTDGLIYNSALVIDGGAVIAHYRKTHLWDREKLIFAPGSQRPPVLHTRHGVIAVMICYDLEFAELTRQVALQGAELIAAPVNWPVMRTPAGEHPGEVITAMSTARTNRVAVAVCDRAGGERGQEWAQATVIIDADGWVVASAGPGPGIAVAEVDLAATHDKKITENVDLFADRRPELY